MSTVADRSLSGNDFGIYLSLQTAKGAIDASPVFQSFRRLEGKAVRTISRVTSGEVKTNRQGREQIDDTSTYSAELSFELSQQTARFLDATIHGAAVDRDVAPITTLSSDANGFVDSGGTAFTSYDVGDWFKTTGFVATGLNTWHKISVKNGNGDVETTVAPSDVEAAGASVTIESTRTRSDSVQDYYTIQNRAVDKSAVGDVNYQTFFDAIVNTGTLEVGETGPVTGALTFNIEELLAGTALIAGQTDSAADTSNTISAVTGTKNVYIDGVVSSCDVKSFGLTFNNNYSEDRSAACSGARYSFGDVEATGALVTRSNISNSFLWRDRYYAGTRFALSAVFEWSDGKWMIIEIPRCVITEHLQPDGTNALASNEMSYAAEEDPTTSSTVTIFRNF